MDTLISADLALFRLINQAWTNPLFDWLMPVLSGNVFFKPAVAILAIGLIWKGGTRGRCYALVLALVLAIGEGLLTNGAKKTFQRPRPFVTHPETRLLVGKGGSFSMPSGHAGIWGAITMVTALYYRRSWRVLGPLAFGVGYSRCYLGVHYPTDVVAGWSFGALYGWLLARGLDRGWGWLGQTCFPLWWQARPSLIDVDRIVTTAPDEAWPTAERHWTRLTYGLLAVLLVGRLIYLGAGVIELSEDEAYQWLWSKHLDWSYYSKPLGIAVAQTIGTTLLGDTSLGVRFLSPVLSALTALIAFRFVRRHASARTGFLMVVAAQATPLLAVGSILMTIDPLTVCFWMVSMVAGWRAISEDSTRWWLVTGLGFAGTLLSKYFSPFQWLSFAVFFVLWPPARAQLRRPGPWLALAINAVACVPVLLWNAHHEWITFRHLGERGGLHQAWRPTARFLIDFLIAVPALMNPVFFVGLIWACVTLWRRSDASGQGSAARAAVLRYCFAMGVPVFVFYLVYTLRARVQPNWIATSILPLLMLAAIWGHWQAAAGARWPRCFLAWGLSIGVPLVVLLHETNWVGKITGRNLPPKSDPLRRVRGFRTAAEIVETQRANLAREGKPVFVIANHYGWAGLLNFYMPEARQRVATDPLVTVRSSDVPENQLWFWPEYRYENRQGHNALFIEEVGEPNPDPERLRREFESVTSLGIFEVEYRGRVFHRLQLYACRNKR
jgi:membrane-associated phospholipid phosphatase/4-amino-4-deoxy-L-arabinose transferase-like glycosyltransferase